MKIILAIIITVISVISPIGDIETTDNPTLDPVFSEFAPSFDDTLSFENIPQDGWGEHTYPHIWLSMNEGKQKKFHLGYYKGNIDFDGHGLVFLQIGAANYLSKLWVNGNPAGTHMGGFLPFEFDITELLHEGQNEVILGVRDYTACFNPNIENPTLETDDALIFPIGSAIQLAGLWLPSKIIRRPRLYVSNCWIDTNLTEKSVAIKVDVNSKLPEEIDCDVSCHIELLSGEKILDLGTSKITIARNCGVADFSKEWTNPKLWSPENPNLYRCVIRIFLENTVIDEKIEQFGFREFKIVGSDFYLNGTKIHLRAASKHLWNRGNITAPIDLFAKSLINEAKSLNCNTLRLHANPFPEVFLKYADEKGILIVNESAAFTRGNFYDLDSELFWLNLRNNWDDQIERDYNHPSWVIASIENELLLSGGKNSEKAEEKLVRLGKYVKEMSKRHIMFEGDGDPGGSSDIINLHYSYEPTAHHTYPQGAFFLDSEFLIQSYPRENFKWNREKPIYIGEFLWLPDVVHAGAVALGDSFLDDTYNNRLLAKSKLFEFYVKAFRLQGVSAMNPWNPLEDFTDENTTVPETTKELFKPVRFFVSQVDVHHFERRELFKTITIQNWSEKPKTLSFKWEFEKQSGSWEGLLNPYEEKMMNIKLDLPETKEKTSQNLMMTLLSGVEVLHQESQEILIYPEKSAESEFVLVGKNRSFEEDLRNLGYRFETYQNLTELTEKGKSNLPVVFAPNSFEENDQIQELLAKNQKKYLVLYPQKEDPIDILSSMNDTDFAKVFPQNGFTITSWVRDFGDFKTYELMEFFAGDNIIAKDAFSLTPNFPMIPVLAADSGYKQFYPILEVPGFGFVSSIAFSEKMSSEPRCSIIFSELISSLSDTDEPKSIALISDESGKEILKKNGFAANGKPGEEAVYYFKNTTQLTESAIKKMNAGSTIILDRFNEDELKKLGIDCNIISTPKLFSPEIKLNKSIFPSLTHGMITDSTRFKFHFMQLNMNPLGDSLISEISKTDYDIRWVVPNYLALLSSNSKPNFLINMMEWGDERMIPLHSILIDLGVDTQFEETMKNNNKQD